MPDCHQPQRSVSRRRPCWWWPCPAAAAAAAAAAAVAAAVPAVPGLGQTLCAEDRTANQRASVASCGTNVQIAAIVRCCGLGRRARTRCKSRERRRRRERGRSAGQHVTNPSFWKCETVSLLVLQQSGTESLGILSFHR